MARDEGSTGSLFEFSAGESEWRANHWLRVGLRPGRRPSQKFVPIVVFNPVRGIVGWQDRLFAWTIAG
jgi:hypothetical protein